MSKGRARSFDLDHALDRAETVFRARGFSGAGVNDLMVAIGIGSGSFYAAFGSKSGLYEQVLSRQAATRLAAAHAALAHPDPRRALARLIEITVADLCRPETPGCLFVLTGAHQLDASAQCWTRYRAALLDALTATCGHLDSAARVMLILDALGTQSAAGCDRAALTALAQDALTLQLSATNGRNWLAA